MSIKPKIQKISNSESILDTSKIIFQAKIISDKIDSLNILVEIINIDIDSLYLDSTFTMGYDDDEFTNLYYKILELKDNKKYEKINEKTADYQYFDESFKKRLLPKGAKVKENIKYILTKLEKGKTYKIRFFYRLSKYGKYNDICTEWVEFNAE